MRKIPLYTLLQELMMQWLMLLLVMGYIIYDFIDYLHSVGYVVLFLIIFLFGISFKKMMNNYTVVMIQTIFTLPNKRDIIKNNRYSILFNLILGIVTVLHFYLVWHFNKELYPLIWEYGIGGILGIGLQIFKKRKPLLGITNSGIALGSQFDLKLVEWSKIERIESLENHFSIHFVKNFPLKTVVLAKNSKTIEVKKLIEKKIKAT